MWWKILGILLITSHVYAGITFKMSSPLKAKKIIEDFSRMLPEIRLVVSEYGEPGMNMLRQGESRSDEEKLGDLRRKAEKLCKGHCGPQDFGAIPEDDQQVAYLDYVLLNEIRREVYVKLLEVIIMAGKDKERAVILVRVLEESIADMVNKINSGSPLYHVPETKMLKEYIKTRSHGLEYMNELIRRDVIGHIEPHGNYRLREFLETVGVYFPPADRVTSELHWSLSRYSPTLFLIFGFHVPQTEEEALLILESPQYAKRKKVVRQKYHPDTTQIDEKVAKKHWEMADSSGRILASERVKFRIKKEKGALGTDPVIDPRRVNDMLWIDAENKGNLLEDMRDVNGPLFVPPGSTVRVRSQPMKVKN